MSPRRSSRAPLLAGNGPLAKVPPVVPFAVVLVVFGLAIWQRGVIGATLLGLLGLGVIVLLAATWRVLRAPDRVLRIVVVLILAGVAISMLR